MHILRRGDNWRDLWFSVQKISGRSKRDQRRFQGNPAVDPRKRRSLVTENLELFPTHIFCDVSRFSSVSSSLYTIEILCEMSKLCKSLMSSVAISTTLLLISISDVSRIFCFNWRGSHLLSKHIILIQYLI